MNQHSSTKTLALRHKSLVTKSLRGNKSENTRFQKGIIKR